MGVPTPTFGCVQCADVHASTVISDSAPVLGLAELSTTTSLICLTGIGPLALALSVAAIIMAQRTLRACAEGRATEGARTKAIVGLVCAIIATIVSVGLLLLLAGLMLTMLRF